MRYCGNIGFLATYESRPGIWTEDIIERTYRGDVIKNGARWENGTSINDNVTITNQISVLADSYILEHTHLMKYIEFLGTKWKISSVDVQRPRLVLTLGGIYNA